MTRTTALDSPAPVISGRLPSPGRAGSILAVLALPFWIGCFVLLYGSLGAKPETTPTTEQLHESYLAAGAPIWMFAVLSVIAALVLALAPVVIAVAVHRLGSQRALSTIVIIAGAIAGILQLWNTLAFLVFLGSEPGDLPGWVALVTEGSDGNTIINAIAWSLCAFTVPVLGFMLRRARIVPRTGLIIGIVGGVILIAVLAFQFGNPMTSSLLLFVLGIALLRRKN